MNGEKTTRTPLYILAAAYAVYALAFILNTSTVAGGTRYFVLFDDAMISMCYAKNFAAGSGLVWYEGAPKVQGFTNLLWVMLMAVPHLLKIAAAKTSLFIQLAGAASVAGAAYFVYRTAREISGSKTAALWAAALVCANLSLNTWALLGTESGAVAMLFTAAAYYGVRNLKTGTFSPVPYILFFIATLLRVDSAVVCGGYVIFMFLYDGQNRKKHLIWAATAALVPAAGLSLFSWLYFGDPMPNTYYLKMQGYPFFWRVARGLWSLAGMAARSAFLPFIIPFLGLLIIKKKEFSLLLWLFCAQALYSVYVGGDAWHDGIGSNRFISQAMPLLLAGLSLTVFEFGSRAGKYKNIAAAATLLLCGVLFNAYNGAGSLRQSLLLDLPLHAQKGKEMIEAAATLESVTKEGALVGVTWAGTVPYFAHRRFLDFLGKNDWHIARQPMQAPPAEAPLLFKIKYFYPGHLKCDPHYALEWLRPDVIISIFGADVEQMKWAVGYVNSNYVKDYPGFYYKKGSDRVRWDVVAKK